LSAVNKSGIEDDLLEVFLEVELEDVVGGGKAVMVCDVEVIEGDVLAELAIAVRIQGPWCC